MYLLVHTKLEEEGKEGGKRWRKIKRVGVQGVTFLMGEEALDWGMGMIALSDSILTSFENGA